MAPKVAMKVAPKRAAKELVASEPEQEETPVMTDEEAVSPKRQMQKQKSKRSPASPMRKKAVEEAPVFKRPAGNLVAEETNGPKAKRAKAAGFSPMVRRLSLDLKKKRKAKAPAEEPQAEAPEAPAQPAKSGKRGRKAKEAAAPESLEPSEAGETKPEKLPKAPKVNKTQELINVIHRTINSIPYKAPPVAGVRLHPCILTSIDEDGYASMRTVVPSQLEPDLSEIRIMTNIDTKKVQEIQKNKRVSVHYQDQRGRGGWVTLKGDAKIHLKGDAEVAEVAVRPERCEVVSYLEGPTSADDGEGWKPAVLVRVGADGWRRTH